MTIHLRNILGDDKPFCGDTAVQATSDDIDDVACGGCFMLLMLDEEVHNV